MNIKGYKVYNQKGKFIRTISVQKEMSLQDNEWLKGVSCFVLNKDGKVLIEKRVNKGLTPGKLDLCSGHIDGDEVPTQAMIRELREELGIQLEESMNVVPVGNLDLQFENKDTNKRNFLIQFYALKRNTNKVEIQKEEVDKICYVPMEEAFELIKKGKTKFPEDDRYEEIFQKVRDVYNAKDMNKKMR